MFNSSLPSAAYMSVSPVSIDSDNDLSPIRRQTIILTRAGLWSIGPVDTNFNGIFNQNTTVFINDEL